jgi:hypothetical protein
MAVFICGESVHLYVKEKKRENGHYSFHTHERMLVMEDPILIK